MQNLDAKIRESLAAYIDGSVGVDTDLSEPMLIVSRRRSPALAVAAAAAFVVVALTGVLAVTVSDESRSWDGPNRPARTQAEPPDVAGRDLTATWLPQGFDFVEYTRQNIPEASQFDSSLVYRGSNGETLLVSRHEALNQADADRDASGQLRADPNPSPGWYGYRLLEGDTLFVVQGEGIADASDQLRLVIDGIRVGDDGNCINGGIVSDDGPCAAGSSRVPDSPWHDETTTTTLPALDAP